MASAVRFREQAHGVIWNVNACPATSNSLRSTDRHSSGDDRQPRRRTRVEHLLLGPTGTECARAVIRYRRVIMTVGRIRYRRLDDARNVLFQGHRDPLQSTGDAVRTSSASARDYPSRDYALVGWRRPDQSWSLNWC